MDRPRNTAAIVTVGSELVEGLRVDTNTAEVARSLSARGFTVVEAISVGDRTDVLAEELRRLVSTRELVVTTGGLGPTHDDITREAAAMALDVELVSDERLVALLRPIQARHTDPAAVRQVLSQAMVLPGAEVIDFTTGTAPGQISPTPAGLLCLLPGPPSEMRPMLRHLLDRFDFTTAPPRELGVVGLPESDAQVLVERAIAGVDSVGFTILAKPGDVRVILTDTGAGEAGLALAAESACSALGDRCHSTDGSSLAERVVASARDRGLQIALAESCTGGMVSAALTDVAGASRCFAGSVVCYSNESKIDLLGVPGGLLAQYGAVSEETAGAMASEALNVFATADISVAITGIAGPDGGTPDKPVGTVWFAVANKDGTVAAFERRFPGVSREAVRARATSVALDCLRRTALGLPLPT